MSWGIYSTPGGRLQAISSQSLGVNLSTVSVSATASVFDYLTRKADRAQGTLPAKKFSVSSLVLYKGPAAWDRKFVSPIYSRVGNGGIMI